MKKAIGIFSILITTTLGFLFFSWLKPGKYQCSWDKRSQTISPSGERVGLLYLKSCSNGGMTTEATYTIFDVKTSELANFSPGDHDSRIIFSREASPVKPSMNWVNNGLVVSAVLKKE